MEGKPIGHLSWPGQEINTGEDLGKNGSGTLCHAFHNGRDCLTSVKHDLDDRPPL